MNNKRIRDYLKFLLAVNAIIGVKIESRAGKSRARKKSWKASFCNFSQGKLALLPLVKEVTPPPDRKMIKLLTFDDLFSPLRRSR